MVENLSGVRIGEASIHKNMGKLVGHWFVILSDGRIGRLNSRNGFEEDDWSKWSIEDIKRMYRFDLLTKSEKETIKNMISEGFFNP